MNRKSKLHPFRVIIGLIIILTFVGCSNKAASSNDGDSEGGVIVTDTTGSLPSNDMAPDYETVFNQSEVMEINIVIDSEDWAAMQADLAANVSSDKQGGRPAINQEQGGRPALNQEQGDRPALNQEQGDRPALNQEQGDRPALNVGSETAEPVGPDSESGYDPIWVESSITVNDLTWDHVGIRVKGNSSLTSTVSSGNNKLSFKLDFDEFEDLYPQVEDQRFYGFKQLNLNNNYNDASLLREKVAADLFNEFGVNAASTAFAVVTVDYGEGSQYYGVYTLVEEMDDTGIMSSFAEDSGNLYKPDGKAASFAEGSFNTAQMEKKNNEDQADYADVEALYEVINSDTRDTDLAAWKSELERVFNVDGFLKYLAVNTVIQNWDTYGNMTHNYYLYNDTETDQLNWIPWDNNEAFSNGKGNSGALSLDLSEVGDDWPLISYLMEDTDYQAVYKGYVAQFVEEVFTVDQMNEVYDSYYELIKDYAYDEVEGYTFIRSDQAFDQAIETLKAHVVERNAAVDSYLGQ